MTGAIGLLLGLIVVPALLTWAGHRLRARSAKVRGAFWGGVIGYAIAMAAFFIAAFAPPLLWGDSSLREAVVFWGLLAGSGAGSVIGSLRPRGAE